jgi:hypothetical protein
MRRGRLEQPGAVVPEDVLVQRAGADRDVRPVLFLPEQEPAAGRAEAPGDARRRIVALQRLRLALARRRERHSLPGEPDGPPNQRAAALAALLALTAIALRNRVSGGGNSVERYICIFIYVPGIWCPGRA